MQEILGDIATLFTSNLLPHLHHFWVTTMLILEGRWRQFIAVHHLEPSQDWACVFPSEHLVKVCKIVSRTARNAKKSFRKSISRLSQILVFKKRQIKLACGRLSSSVFNRCAQQPCFRSSSLLSLTYSSTFHLQLSGKGPNIPAELCSCS